MMQFQAEAQASCQLFGICGGCSYQDIPYARELELKREALLRQFSDLSFISESLIDPVVASSKEYHYRHRLDLKVVRTRDDRLLMGFTPRDIETHGFGLIETDTCPIAMPAVSGALPGILDDLRRNLPKECRRGNILVRTGDDGRVLWGGIGKNSLHIEPKDFFWTDVCGKRVFYSLDCFFQANLSILPKLFERIYALDCWGQDTVFYDLYGGVGLFGVMLADHAGRVFLIEESVTSTRVARHNVAFHRFSHFEIIDGKVEQHFPRFLAQEDFKDKRHVAMIDPPRKGLSPQSVKFLNQLVDRVDTMLYLSCNPKSLVENLKGLHKGGWQIQRVIPFDFFPKTHHLETLVILKGVKC